MNIATFDLAPIPLRDLMALREAVERVVDEVVRGDITHKEQNAMTETLDGLSIEQLRELARRAEATAKARVRAEKDKVPPVGTEWEYGGRYYETVREGAAGECLVYSIAKKGGAIRAQWLPPTFSGVRAQPIYSRTWNLSPSFFMSHHEKDVIIRLVLRVAG